MISKKQYAIGVLNTVIERWEETFPMLHEHPELKDELMFIRGKLEEKNYRGLRLAENHMYYVLKEDTYEVDLVHDLERIFKAIQDIGSDLVHRAAITSATLLDSFGYEELTERDLEVMQDCVTRLENLLDPVKPCLQKKNTTS